MELRLDDLDWERGRILVRKGKGQRSRKVPFIPGVQKSIRGYLAHRQDSNPALWITEKGVRLQYHGIEQDMRRLYQRVGVDVVDSVHIFRRSLATAGARQRMPRWFTNRILGWRDDQMQSYYTAGMEDEDEAIQYFTRNFTPLGEEAAVAAEPRIWPTDAIELEESAAPKFLQLRDVTYYCRQRIFIVVGEERIEITADQLPGGE